MTPDSNTFFISIKGFGWRRSWLFALPFALVLYLLWPLYYVVILLVVAFVACMGIWVLFVVVLGTVTVHSGGIVLYGANRLAWTNIVAVDRRLVFGMPYLQVTRVKGFGKWWLPLYLQNEAGFYASIITHAPNGNALRNYAESVQHGRLG